MRTIDATCEPTNPNARVVRWIIAKPSFDWRLQLAWVIMGSGWACWVQYEYGK